MGEVKRGKSQTGQKRRGECDWREYDTGQKRDGEQRELGNWRRTARRPSGDGDGPPPVTWGREVPVWVQWVGYGTGLQ